MYAVYEGDIFKYIGTMEEVLNKEKIKKRSLQVMVTPSYIKSRNGKGKIIIKI